MVTDWLTAAFVMAIAEEPLTVKVAEALVTLPAELVTINVECGSAVRCNRPPESCRWTKLLPRCLAPFFRHW